MIEVGEYVRTETGYIGIVENINDFRPPEAKICVDFNVPDLIFLGETDIIKHSKDIIDLIEVGDYVNGYKVEEVMEEMGTWKRFLEMTSNYTNKEIGDCTIREDKDIKTILTKESYMANCYKVGGE